MDRGRETSKKRWKSTQLKLCRVKIPVCEVVSRLIKSLEVNRWHFTKYWWCNLMLCIELAIFNPNKHRVICSNFGATLDLCSSKKGNCSVDNHSVMWIFFVVSEWWEVEYINTKGNLYKTIISNCDKWVFFGHTISKGENITMCFITLALTTSSPIMMKKGGEMI